MKRGKQYRSYLEAIDKDKKYTINQACQLLKDNTFAKFDESVEVAFKLGIDPKQADQAVRGTLSLPHGTGKDVRIVVICSDSDIKAAEEAGAIEVGSDELVDKIAKGFLDFDIVIATPAMMGKVGKLGKLLGARGMMPSPKSGTVTQDVAKTVTEFKSGKVEYRNDKAGIVHIVIGKASFSQDKLVENFRELYDTIQKIKPQKAKGTYIQSLVVSTTMSPALNLCPVKTFEEV
tara:strand:- start:32 stop:730 length:699 start_codon:yes stop_codon:yes gene_type:complete